MCRPPAGAVGVGPVGRAVAVAVDVLVKVAVARPLEVAVDVAVEVAVALPVHGAGVNQGWPVPSAPLFATGSLPVEQKLAV
jgi:hypothetical protein